MSNPTIRDERAKKAHYNKPSIAELNASAGTLGMGTNNMGGVKDNIGPENIMMRHPS